MIPILIITGIFIIISFLIGIRVGMILSKKNDIVSEDKKPLEVIILPNLPQEPKNVGFKSSENDEIMKTKRINLRG